MKLFMKLWTFRRQMAFFFYGGADKLGGNIRLAVAVLSRRSDVDLSQEQVAIFTLTNLGETDKLNEAWHSLCPASRLDHVVTRPYITMWSCRALSMFQMLLHKQQVSR